MVAALFANTRVVLLMSEPVIFRNHIFEFLVYQPVLLHVFVANCVIWFFDHFH